MALVIADRVKETTTTTGTGTINLAGASNGFQSFVSGVGTTNTTYYAITDANGAWEVGIGTVTDADPDTLSRDTIIANSNGDTSAITLSSGAHVVFGTYPAGKAVHLDASGNLSHTVDISSDTNLAGGTGITLTGDTLSTTDSEIVHDNLSGFVANEHIDHSGVSVTAGDGLSGGGTIASTRTINVDINGASDLASPAVGDELLISDADDSNAIKKADVASIVNLADHDALTNFVANEHIDHSSVSVSAGTGLTGGGTIASNRTLSVDINGTADLASPAVADELLISDADDSDTVKKADLASIVNLADHDALTNFVANEHVDHSSVSVSAGTGLSGGGTIASTRTLSVDINGTADLASPAVADELLISDADDSNTVKKADLASIVNLADHDQLTNFVANEHIDHSSVSVTAGAGLTGGGTIASTRTINVVGGDGITANADEIEVTVDDSTIELSASDGSGSVRIKDGGVTNAKLSNDGITIAGADTSLGGSITADTIAGQISVNTITFTQIVDLARGSILYGNASANTAELTKGSANTVLQSDGTDISWGTVTNAMLAGSIANAKLANDSVSYGGVSLDLGGTDATPAFDLADATNYPTSSLIGTITNAQLAGSIANAKLTNSSITVSDGSNTTAVSLGGTMTFSGTSNEIEVAESSGTVTIGLPDNVTIAGNLTINGTTTTVDSTTLSVADPLIILASGNNASDTVDIGFYGLYDTSSSLDLYAGLFRDASDSGKFKLFKDLQAAPTTTVNTSGTGYAVATLVANIEGDVTGDLTGNADTVTTNANLTGHVTSTGNAAVLGSFTVAQLSTALSDASISGNNNGDVTLAGTPDYITISGQEITRNAIDLANHVTGTLPVGSVSTITLGTNTAGNYVSTITGGTGITSTGATSGEGIAHSLSVDAAQTQITSVGTLTSLTVDDVAIDGKIITMTGSADDTAVITVGTHGALSIVTTDDNAAAANIEITADGTVDINSAGALTLDSGAAINIEPAAGSAILLDGTISIDAGVVTGATSITSTTFVGDLTGNADTVTNGVYTTSKISVLAATSSSELAGVISDETGSGALVFANSPTLVTPALGTPSALVATNATGTAANLTAGTATVATTVTITDNENTDESNAIIFAAGGDIDGGNLGLESDGTLTYNPSTGKITATGFIGALTGNADTVTNGVYTTNNLSVMAATTSAQLAGVISDETGSGALVFANSPTLVTPALGTPSALVGTNITGTGANFTAGTATVATTVTITDNENTDEDNAIVFTAGGDVDGGNLGLESDGHLTYNPSTGKITATGFIGALTGNADTATEATSITVSANNSADETVYPIFVDGATGTQGAETDTGLTYNPNSGLLTAAGFSGPLTGNVTGNTSGSSGSCTGNAATATALASAVNIAGKSFDGSGSITIATTDLSDITALDTDLSSVSGSDNSLASAKAIKTYVDAQVTAQDLDATTDSGTIDIDLDSDTLTVAGGTGVDTSATGTTITVAIDSTVATLTGSQTLTNKVLTSPDINTPDIDGGTIDGATIATSDVTVGSGKTLDVSAGTLTTSAAQNLAIVQGAASNIDIGAYELRAQTLESDVSTGTAPLTVASTTVVTNLNADQLDGQDGSHYLDYGNFVIDDDEIPIAKLAADKVTIGSTDVTLGATVTTFAGLSSVTSTEFLGGLTGTATNATHVTVTDNENENENNLIPFIEDASATGNVGLESDGDFHYNPSTGKVTATAFAGALTGNVTGNASGSSGSCTGNAATATALASAVNIAGKSFDGSGSITIATTDLSDITALDTDLSSVSGSDNSLASAKAIKTYVDAQVTAQDLDATTDSGTIDIDLDSDTLTVAGGTGVDTSATGTTITVAIDSTVATLTGSQTLTNKVLTSPDINTPDIDGGTIDGATIATSDVTVGSGKTLDVSAGTLTTSAAQNLAIVQGAASNIDIGAYELRAQTLESDVSTGTAPLTVASTTVVTNLNADQLDGQDGSHYLDYGNFVIDDDEIPIAKLAADKVTIGSTDVTLGATVTTFAGLSSVTSTEFLGGLTGTATNATHVTVTDNENENENNLIPFIEDASATGNVGLESDGDFHYNPSTGTVTATIFKGNIDAVDGDFDGTLEADAITIGGTAIGSIYSAIAGSSSIVTTGALDSGSITSGFGNIDNGSSSIACGSLDVSDGNITNVGDIDCDSISVADAANGLNVDLSSANTGTGKITLKDNVASALDITESSNSYIKFNTQDAIAEVTYSKEAVEVSKPLKCTKAIHSAVSKANAVSTGQTLFGGGNGNTITLDLAEANFFRVQLTANVDEIHFKNQAEGQKVIIRFEQDSTGSRTVDFTSSFYALDTSGADPSINGTAVNVQWPSDTPPTLTTTGSKADIIGLLNFGIPAGAVHGYNAVLIGQNFD